MNVMINLHDLLAFIAYAVGITAGIFLIIIFVKIIKTLNAVNDTIKHYQPEIDRTMKQVPRIAENAGDLTDSVKNTVDVAGESLGLVGDILIDTSSNILGQSDNIGKISKVMAEVLKGFGYFFSKMDKNKNKGPEADYMDREEAAEREENPTEAEEISAIHQRGKKTIDENIAPQES